MKRYLLSARGMVASALGALLVSACGGSQVTDSNKPSYDDYHASYKPHGRLLEPGNPAVRVMAAMEAGPAAGILAVYLNKGQQDLYRRLVCSVPRKSAGALVDALESDVQVSGVEVLGKDCGQDVLFYVSRGTYAAVAPELSWLPAATAPTQPAKAAPDPAKGEGPAGWQRAAGRYVLVSIDGKSLPYTYPSGGVMKNGATEFKPDGTFVYDSEVIGGGKLTQVRLEGTWWVQGEKMSWAVSGLSDNVGQLRGDEIVSTAGGVTYISRRAPVAPAAIPAAEPAAAAPAAPAPAAPAPATP